MTMDSRVLILLSTYNGGTYLRAQLDSLLAQRYANWTLYWRDDGSEDDTVSILVDFMTAVGGGQCVRIVGPTGRLGPAASFMAVLRAAAPAMGIGDVVAFADQDDVWLPSKLSRGVAAVMAADAGTPILYCARLVVVNASLAPQMETSFPPRVCGFPASLTQNIATGCTVMLNRRATRLVADSVHPSASPHDWWCYLLVTAAGGRVLFDNAAVALYRQHGGNFIGIPLSTPRRAIAALRRGPHAFVDVLRQHLAALAGQPDLMCETARPVVMQLQHALQGSFWQKLNALRLPGLRRQSVLETLLFRLWFLVG
jgi:glycosyltransferase involved in cell wall biosynthesis